jgi:hypothetical protein
MAAEEKNTTMMKICIKMAAASIPLVILTTYSCINIVFTICYIVGYSISTRFGSLGTQSECKGKLPFVMPCRTQYKFYVIDDHQNQGVCVQRATVVHIYHFQLTTINMHVINLMACLMMPFNCEKMITVMRKRAPLSACHKKVMHACTANENHWDDPQNDPECPWSSGDICSIFV